jgi:ABC-type lipoprotein export system ATPase subunit
MRIRLSKVIPTYLEKEKVRESEVWNSDITITEDERVQIIATSGRGKTSLVHFLYGLRRDYDGTISYNDTDVKQMNSKALADIRKDEISIIFQDLRLFPEHTAFENINVKRQLAPYHAVSRIEEMAENLGIKSKLNQAASKCSYGEQQRIAIIRALQQPFKLIVMDEPFSNLDEVNRQKAMQLVEKEATERNASILLLDLKEIEYFKPDKTYKL